MAENSKAHFYDILSVTTVIEIDFWKQDHFFNLIFPNTKSVQVFLEFKFNFFTVM